MCLELFVMIKETPGIEPNPIVSPYVLTGKLSREKSPHFFRHFPKKQLFSPKKFRLDEQHYILTK